MSIQFGSTRVAIEPPRNVELEKQNLLLEESYSFLTQNTYPASSALSDSDATQISQKILDEYLSGSDCAMLSNYLKEITHGVTLGKKYEDIKPIAVIAALDVVDKSQYFSKNEPLQVYTKIRNRLSLTKISLPEAINDFDLDNFSIRNEGRLTLCDDGTPLPTVWKNLGKEFGLGFFPERIVESVNQLEYIESVLDIFEPPRINPYSQNLPIKIDLCANAILAETFLGCAQTIVASFDGQRLKILSNLELIKQSQERVWIIEERSNQTIQQLRGEHELRCEAKERGLTVDQYKASLALEEENRLLRIQMENEIVKQRPSQKSPEIQKSPKKVHPFLIYTLMSITVILVFVAITVIFIPDTVAPEISTPYETEIHGEETISVSNSANINTLTYCQDRSMLNVTFYDIQDVMVFFDVSQNMWVILKNSENPDYFFTNAIVDEYRSEWHLNVTEDALPNISESELIASRNRVLRSIAENGQKLADAKGKELSTSTLTDEESEDLEKKVKEAYERYIAGKSK